MSKADIQLHFIQKVKGIVYRDIYNERWEAVCTVKNFIFNYNSNNLDDKATLPSSSFLASSELSLTQDFRPQVASSGRTATDSSHTSFNLAKQTPAECSVRTTRYARARTGRARLKRKERRGERG